MKKNILILGSNGQLGSKLSISLKKDKKFKIKTLAKSNANFSFDIENFSKLEEILINENFTHVINCIAHTNLEYCEKNYKKIYKINVLLPKKLSDLSKNHKFKLVHISTDHIYKAKKNKLNSEKDKVGWHNNYSKSTKKNYFSYILSNCLYVYYSLLKLFSKYKLIDFLFL